MFAYYSWPAASLPANPDDPTDWGFADECFSGDGTISASKLSAFCGTCDVDAPCESFSELDPSTIGSPDDVHVALVSPFDGSARRFDNVCAGEL